MAFEEISIETGRGDSDTGVTVSLIKMRGAPARLKVVLKERVMTEMGFTASDRLSALLGTEEHHGLLRLQKNKSGPVAISHRDGPHKSQWWEISLGHRTEFIDRTEKARACQWDKIDLTTIEIVLPGWADETRPRAAKVVTATPPALIAGRRDQAAQKREADEAASRRASREAAEEGEAWSEFKQRLDSAPVAQFDPALKLTRSEKALLTILADRAGRVVSKEGLATLLYADRPNDPPDEKIVDVWVCKIRPKIADRGCTIETVWGEGVRFTGDPMALARVTA